MAGVPAGMGRSTRAVTCMRRRQGIPAPRAGPAMEVLAIEDLREPIRSSIAAPRMAEGSMAVVFMEGDSTEEGMEAGTGDRVCRCWAKKRGMVQILPRGSRWSFFKFTDEI